ncbi:ERAP1-like C-terminal domain-containing protein, partial [Klebsiella pneumoniae]|nr:ERAP1-like C-terminal domain-containing protein [Klebsiella pneumoniae]
PQSVRDGINRFRADVFGPMARELTFEFGANDSSELRELRETVITAAASAGDTWTLDEIRRRFAPLQEHGDYSLIHPDLLRTVLSQA